MWLSSNLTVSNYAPLNPANGDCWYNTLSAITELKIYDGTNSAWVNDTNSVYVGKCTVYSGHVLSCLNRAFNSVLKPAINAVGSYYVKVIDYDGSLIDMQYLNAGDIYTLPTQPEHDGLIFQEWSSTKPIVNNTITITNNNVLVGAVYDTASGMSEFDIQIKGGQNISLDMSGTKDWGDGTTDTNGSHTYSTTGNYTIKCNGTINSSLNNNIVGTGNTPYVDFIKAVRLSSNITTIPFQTFYKLTSVRYISIPRGVTTIGGSSTQGTGTFGGARHLTHLILPSTVTSLVGPSFANECYALKTFIAPTITSIPSNCLSYCSGLNELVLSDTITSFGTYAFNSCTNLTGTVVMPSGLTSIGQYAFAYNNSIDVYDFSNCTSVPTLDNTNAFTLQQSDKIYVPADLIDQWKAASNWSSIKGYITVKP